MAKGPRGTGTNSGGKPGPPGSSNVGISPPKGNVGISPPPGGAPGKGVQFGVQVAGQHPHSSYHCHIARPRPPPQPGEGIAPPHMHEDVECLVPMVLVNRPNPAPSRSPPPPVKHDLNDYVVTDKKNVFTLNQGHIAISTTGENNIYSGGFSGCLGLILTPVGRPGGLVSHVAQTGNKTKSPAGKKKYLAEAIEGALKLAKEHGLTPVNMALFRGDIIGNDESKLEFTFEEMRALIEGLESRGMVEHIEDELGHAFGDQLLLDTKTHALSVWKLYGGDFKKFLALMDQAIEDQPRLQRFKGKAGPLHLEEGNSNNADMPLHIIDDT